MEAPIHPLLTKIFAIESSVDNLHTTANTKEVDDHGTIKGRIIASGRYLQTKAYVASLAIDKVRLNTILNLLFPDVPKEMSFSEAAVLLEQTSRIFKKIKIVSQILSGEPAKESLDEQAAYADLVRPANVEAQYAQATSISKKVSNLVLEFLKYSINHVQNFQNQPGNMLYPYFMIIREVAETSLNLSKNQTSEYEAPMMTVVNQYQKFVRDEEGRKAAALSFSRFLSQKKFTREQIESVQTSVDCFVRGNEHKAGIEIFTEEMITSIMRNLREFHDGYSEVLSEDLKIAKISDPEAKVAEHHENEDGFIVLNSDSEKDSEFIVVNAEKQTDEFEAIDRNLAQKRADEASKHKRLSYGEL